MFSDCSSVRPHLVNTISQEGLEGISSNIGTNVPSGLVYTTAHIYFNGYEAPHRNLTQCRTLVNPL